MNLHGLGNIPDLPDAVNVGVGTECIPKGELAKIKDGVIAMDPAATHPHYDSKNIVTAYLQHLVDEVRAIDLGDPAFVVSEPDIQKQIVVMCNIALSQLISGIDVKLSYIRLGADGPFHMVGPDKMSPGKHFLDTIFEEWAKMIDNSLRGKAAGGKTSPPMLCVVMLNNFRIAYYSSKNDGIIFYPFNTVKASQVDPNLDGLIGINVDENGSLRYNMDELIGELAPYPGNLRNDNRITDQVVADLCGVLNKWAAKTIYDKSIKWTINTIESRLCKYCKFCGNNVPTAAPIMMPEPIKAFDFETLAPLADNQMPIDGYESLVVYRPFNGIKCAVYFSKYELLAVKAEDGVIVSYGKNIIPDTGLTTVQPVDPFMPTATYNGVSSTMIIPLNVETGNYFCDTTDGLFFYVDPVTEQVKCVDVFLDKLYATLDVEIVPVTKAFSAALKKLNMNLVINTSPEYMEKMTKANLSLSEATVTVTVGAKAFKRTYSKSKESIVTRVSEFEHEEIPQISIFPFINAEIKDGPPVITKYFWTAFYGQNVYGKSEAVYDFFKELIITDDDGNTVSFGNDVRGYIKQKISAHMMATTSCIPSYIHIEYNGFELGRLTFDNPEPIFVDPKKNATAGLDMGSRNSIMAIKADGGGFGYMFDNGKLRKIVFRGTPTAYDEQQKISYGYSPEQSELLGLDIGLDNSGKNIEYSFVSYLMASGIVRYATNQNGETTARPMGAVLDMNAVPLIDGRICGNIGEELYAILMKRALEEADIMAAGGARTASAFGAIDMYGNFKKELLKASTDKKFPFEVQLFLRECVYRMIINAIFIGCGNINIKFSAPDEATGKILFENGWDPALTYIVDNAFFNKDNLTVNVEKKCVPEAEALYTNVKSNLNKHDDVEKDISFIIDGGDSTFDVSMICKADKNGDPILKNQKSLAYAGYSIIVKSVTEICDIPKIRNDINNNANKFVEMWGGNGINGIVVSDDVKDYRKKIIGTVFPQILDNSNTPGKVDSWQKDTYEQMVYKLIEKTTTTLDKDVNYIAKYIVKLIELKYVMTLYISLFECVDDETRNKSDKPIPAGVYLYGGTNNVGKTILWHDNTELILAAIAGIMNHRESAYLIIRKNKTVNIMITNTKKKKELVEGLIDAAVIVDATKKQTDSNKDKDEVDIFAEDAGVKSNNENDEEINRARPNDENKEETLENSIHKFDLSSDALRNHESFNMNYYNKFIETVFNRQYFEGFWENDVNILKYDDEREFNDLISDITDANDPKANLIEYVTSDFASNVNGISDKGLIYMLIFKLAVKKYKKYVEDRVNRGIDTQ